MKKQLLAAAIAGLFVVPAVAQVTVSGSFDTSYKSVKKNGTEELGQRLVDSSLRSTSALRMSGSEDLGGGLKAHFLLEEGLNTRTGAKETTFNRGALVGVSGGFGTFNIGKLNSTFLTTLPTYMNFGGNVNALSTDDGVTTTNTIGTDRPDNSIQYISPTFNGMSVVASMSTGGQTTAAATKDNGRQTQFALQGKVGALSFIVGTASQDTATGATPGVASVFIVTNGTTSAIFTGGTSNTSGGTVVAGQVTPTTGTNATITITPFTAAVAARTGEIKNTGLGLSYDFGMAKVTYQRLDGKTTRSDVTDNVYKFVSQGISAEIPMGAYSTFLNVRDFKNKTSAAATNLDHTGMTVGVQYSLSKRTNVYALYDRVKNDTASAQHLRGTTSPDAGEDPTQIAIGIRHSF